MAANKKSTELENEMGQLGVDLRGRQGHFRSRSKTRNLKRKRDPSAMDTSSSRATSLGRSKSRTRDESGVRDPEMLGKAKKLAKISQRKMIKMGKAGESDRHIHEKRPRHLYSGKRGVGKTDRR